MQNYRAPGTYVKNDNTNVYKDGIEFTVLEIQLRSVNYTIVARICKNFEQN